MRRRHMLALVGAAAMVCSPPAASRAIAQLPSCSISTSGVAFGNYSVFSTAPLTATGTINYQCTLAVLVRVELSTGGAGVYAPRAMQPGAAVLDYNLYLDAGHTTIWGDGSAGTGRIAHLVVALFPHAATVHGLVPAQQDVPAGLYSDTVTATIIW